MERINWTWGLSLIALTIAMHATSVVLMAPPNLRIRVKLKARRLGLRHVLPAYRGRSTHYWAPPAQIRTCGLPAYGSYLGCLTAKRMLGQGCRIRGLGSHASASWAIRSHVVRSLWLRRRSVRSHKTVT